MLPNGFKPNLAGDASDVLDKVKFPVYASPKIDGVRLIVDDGITYTRSLKEIPNAGLRQWFLNADMPGVPVDGELVCGPANAPNVMQATTSQFMSKAKGLPDDWTYIVFDAVDADNLYDMRYENLENWFDGMKNQPNITLMPQTLVRSADDLAEFEAEQLALGYEGIMIRDLFGAYKHGRSTVREGGLLKVKRFQDAEAVVIGVEEEMHNANDAKTNELGRTQRSTAQSGLVGKGRLGALRVRALNGPFAGAEFRIGTGFTATERQEFWDDYKMTPSEIIGGIVTYKFFGHGCVDAPRHPVFKAFRAKEDLE